MTKNLIEMIGYTAAIITTISFLPQMIKIIRLKKTSELSLVMYILYSFGIFLWFIYGLLIWSLPVIIANFVTLILAVIILSFKIKLG